MGRILKYAVILVALAIAIGAVTYKPLRVAVPGWMGMTCVTETVCVEDLTQADRAIRMHGDAVAKVAAHFGPFRAPPRMLFCSTDSCAAKFGMLHARGFNITTIAGLINPAGWQDYILEHELIHRRQNEEFGAIPASATLPRWFIEGSAYVLSEDPRRPFPLPHIEEWIVQYEDWAKARPDWRDHP